MRGRIPSGSVTGDHIVTFSNQTNLENFITDVVHDDELEDPEVQIKSPHIFYDLFVPHSAPPRFQLIANHIAFLQLLHCYRPPTARPLSS